LACFFASDGSMPLANNRFPFSRAARASFSPTLGYTPIASSFWPPPNR
jgi:hypothetical protein